MVGRLKKSSTLVLHKAYKRAEGMQVGLGMAAGCCPHMYTLDRVTHLTPHTIWRRSHFTLHTYPFYILCRGRCL